MVLTNDDSKRMCYQHFQQMWNTEEFGRLPSGKMFQKYMEQLKRPDGRSIRISTDKIRFQSLEGGPYKYYTGVERRGFP